MDTNITFADGTALQDQIATVTTAKTVMLQPTLFANKPITANFTIQLIQSQDVQIGCLNENARQTSPTDLKRSNYFLGMDAASGICYKKGQALKLKLPPMSPGAKIQFEVNAMRQSMTMEVLPEDEGVPEHRRVRTVVTLDGLPPCVVPCVGFGPAGGSVKLIQGHVTASDDCAPTKLVKDLWDADNKIEPLHVGVANELPQSWTQKLLLDQIGTAGTL